MSLWSIWLVGFGVSADAFAASLTSGVKMGRFNYRHALVVALTFAGFQAAMPLLGWLLAANFTSLLDPFDHWIAFALLAIIGGKMAWEAFQADENEDDDGQGSRLDLRRLLILSGIVACPVGTILPFPHSVLGNAVVAALAVGLVVTTVLRWRQARLCLGQVHDAALLDVVARSFGAHVSLLSLDTRAMGRLLSPAPSRPEGDAPLRLARFASSLPGP